MKPTALYRVLASSFNEGEWQRQTGTLMLFYDGDSSKAVYVEDDTNVRRDVTFSRAEILASEQHPGRSTIFCKKNGVVVAQFIAYKRLPLDGDTVRMSVVRAVATPKVRTDGEAAEAAVVRGRGSEQQGGG